MKTAARGASPAAAMPSAVVRSDDQEEPEAEDEKQHGSGAELHEIGETVPDLLVPQEFGISHREILE
jgi:hypothetical protein